jgi:hypothetical protein
VDIDADPQLLQKFNDEVPVVLIDGRKGIQIPNGSKTVYSQVSGENLIAAVQRTRYSAHVITKFSIPRKCTRVGSLTDWRLFSQKPDLALAMALPEGSRLHFKAGFAEPYNQVLDQFRLPPDR